MDKEYTVKEIADLLEVSKPTVQKKLNDLKLDPSTIKGNRCRYYSYDAAIKVIKSIRADFDITVLGADQESTKVQNFGAKTQNESAKIGAKSQEVGAKMQNESAKTQNFGAKSQNESAKTQSDFEKDQIEVLKDLVNVIQEQLKEKDKQLEVKDRQIQDLNNRLAEAMALTKGQQYIAAADKTTDLIEAQSKQMDPKEDPEAERQPEPLQPKKQVNKPKKKGFFKRFFK